MLALVITILRALFLILLYLFIFRLTTSMIEQIRNIDRSSGSLQYPENHPPVNHLPGQRHLITDGDGAILKVVTSGDDFIKIGEVFLLGDETRLGRGPGNHIIFSGHYASQEHTRIVYKQGQYWLEDLDSLNHTFLNDVPIDKQTVLANGDLIRIGDVIFHFVRWAYEMESDK
ncbi:FHA domain-containing protein [Desulfotomaculum sp. 1211_IL3151]|uniref:FHA domain-containing protein n=1 Tax=Desulfotomaculum sp. 1211_IL3151 TaxID=3084055 RepID=UPI002FD87D20